MSDRMLEFARGVTSYPEHFVGEPGDGDISDSMSGPDMQGYHHLGKRALRQGIQQLDCLYEQGSLAGYERFFYEAVIQNDRMNIPVDGNLPYVLAGMRSYEGEFRDVFMTALEPYMRRQGGLGLGEMISFGMLAGAALGARAGEWVAERLAPRGLPSAMMRYADCCAGSTKGTETYK